MANTTEPELMSVAAEELTEGASLLMRELRYLVAVRREEATVRMIGLAVAMTLATSLYVLVRRGVV